MTTKHVADKACQKPERIAQKPQRKRPKNPKSSSQGFVAGFRREVVAPHPRTVARFVAGVPLIRCKKPCLRCTVFGSLRSLYIWSLCNEHRKTKEENVSLHWTFD
jgi:hypothetical protein